ncbi:hypothetical protein [Vibrio diabolicus]|uniref:hypothetical protein n=1 Tax=Vibrio diabolicus TaxID=50719 RepID=UPI002151DCE3|nr:hypothetical protein [Vibrio diabolicus]EJG1580998.1 hypothetical protein [Vibrio parahaemolyticus]MCE9831058.1 hypothetical protein [Vibrio diabolicus]MCS0453217.1 hypothetical protein [Vibrio diabolicus]
MITKQISNDHTLNVYLKPNVNANISVVVEMLPEDVLFEIIKDVSSNGVNK